MHYDFYNQKLERFMWDITQIISAALSDSRKVLIFIDIYSRLY